MRYRRLTSAAVIVLLAIPHLAFGQGTETPTYERGWWARSREYVPVDTNASRVAEFVRGELAAMKSRSGETCSLGLWRALQYRPRTASWPKDWSSTPVSFRNR